MLDASISLVFLMKKPFLNFIILLKFLSAPLFGQEAGDIGFRLVAPAPAAAPVPQGETTAVPPRIRIRQDASADTRSPDENAAAQIALQGAGYVAPGRNVIRPGMQVRVVVLVQGREEISTAPQRINESGRIALPHILNVPVANLSLEEIEAHLSELYSEFFRAPHVIVEYVGSTEDPYLSPWGYVTLMGNVARSGPVAVPPTQTMTVSGAIKTAGGTSASANESSIIVFRPNLEEQTVDRIAVDLRNVGRRGNHENDVLVRAGDVIFVPERIF